MKKIFGGSRRSRTPGAPGGGDAGAANANGMLQASNAAHHASPAGLSSQHLIRPTPVYAVSSPQLGSTHHSASAAYPSPPPSLPPASSSHGHAPSLTVSSRVLSPPPAPAPALSRGLSTSSAYHGTRPTGSVTPVGQQDVITETDPSAELIELEGKLSVGIDFGTTFSGVAYGSSRHMGGAVRQILNWPGSYETYRKVPTAIVYYQPTPAEEAIIVAWGIEAKAMTLRPGFYKVEWFKLFLDPMVLREGRYATSASLPALPPGKEPIDVVTDYLSCLWQYAKERITEEIGSVADLEAADVILTVPAAWDAAGCQLMRTAAINAGMVQSASGGDRSWRERLQIITEPEAAAIQASTMSSLFKLKPSQTFIICDAGGGTVDTAVYKLIGQLSQLEIAEVCSRSGANCGSLFLDLRFEALVKSLLRDHPVHLDEPSLIAFRHSFADCDKLMYRGEADDDIGFRFNCFNIEDAHDPNVGLEFGELVIPGRVLRRDVFSPVVEDVLALLRQQLAKLPSGRVDALILVGGFASSAYLCSRIQSAFGSLIPIVARPTDADVATLQGAARYGLGLIGGKGTVSSVISPRSYCMKCKLPATDEDGYQRPGFISVNQAGVEVCANRLSYLVAKGAVLRKGQRLKSRYCKFSRAPSDCIFTAVLYVSDSDQIYRYTDEGPIEELCRWTVDLSPLPTFQQNAQLAREGASPSGFGAGNGSSRDGGGGGEGFYTEFALGLVLDSAEVIGVLLTDEGEEVGRATFEFL